MSDARIPVPTAGPMDTRTPASHGAAPEGAAGAPAHEGRRVRTRQWSRLGLAGVMVTAGILHFVVPRFYERIVPHVLGHERELVYLSGVAELLCGALLVVPRTRRVGAWITLVLLIVVYPANIQMAVDAGTPHDAESWAAWLRLPVQVPLWRWAYVHTKP